MQRINHYLVPIAWYNLSHKLSVRLSTHLYYMLLYGVKMAKPTVETLYTGSP